MKKTDEHNVRQEIILKIRQLEEGRNLLDKVATEKVRANIEYTKQLGVVIIRLRQGKPMSVPDEPDTLIESPPATIIEKVAKSMCWKEQLKLDDAEAQYKLCYEKLKLREAQLNAWQSILRYWEKVESRE